jgi:hypothetical protein
MRRILFAWGAVGAAALALVVSAWASVGSATRPRTFTTRQIISGFRAETGKLLIRVNTNYIHTHHQGDVLTLLGNRYLGYTVTVFNPGWTLDTTGYYTHRPIKPDAAGDYWKALPGNTWVINKKFGQNVVLGFVWSPPTPALAQGPRIKPVLSEDWDWFDSVLTDVTSR